MLWFENRKDVTLYVNMLFYPIQAHAQAQVVRLTQAAGSEPTAGPSASEVIHNMAPRRLLRSSFLSLILPVLSCKKNWMWPLSC
jgi:hypothetical protein